MFSSEKVLQMRYADYQGKEALIEKFKNSCVMDERESWRPKIFYSSGPNQGLPEPFPSPSHFRRKERSAQNRGSLHVPSGGSERERDRERTSPLGNRGGLFGHSAPFRRPNQHPQNLARHTHLWCLAHFYFRFLLQVTGLISAKSVLWEYGNLIDGKH